MNYGEQSLLNYINWSDETNAIRKDLLGVTFKLNKNKTYLIKKDGNKVGKRKHDIFLCKYFDYLKLKININSSYGIVNGALSTMLYDPKIHQTLTQRTRSIVNGN